MTIELSKIRFVAANYSRLQGLKAIPVGMLVVFVSVWSTYNRGPAADLTAPLLATAGTILLYWLTDHYYLQSFGQVKQTSRQRNVEVIAGLIFGVLALLAFWLDTAALIPVSTLGLVFAISFLEYFWRTDELDWRKIFSFFPENIVAAILILIISILPVFGLEWWMTFGMKSQVVSVFMVIGIVIIVSGVWGHVRLIRALPEEKGK